MITKISIKKKIKKVRTKYTIKRNTFCGHPLCLDCFKRINEFDNGACPICRSYYRETGDINADIWEEEITEEMVFDMIKRRDDGILPELVDWMGVVRQSVIADGLASLTDCRCEYTMNDESMFFGVVDF